MEMPMSPPPSSMETMRMKNSFNWDSNVVFLFPQWPGNGTMYVVALMLVFAVSILKEYLSLHHPHQMGNNKVWGGAALIHTVHVAVGYLLMLAVMSYNLGVFIVVLAGSGFGFYVFHRLLEAKREAAVPESKG